MYFFTIHVVHLPLLILSLCCIFSFAPVLSHSFMSHLTLRLFLLSTSSSIHWTSTASPSHFACFSLTYHLFLSNLASQPVSLSHLTHSVRLSYLARRTISRLSNALCPVVSVASRLSLSHLCVGLSIALQRLCCNSPYLSLFQAGELREQRSCPSESPTFWM